MEYKWLNEEWWLNLKRKEEEAEGIKAFQAACAATDAFVDTHEVNWRIVGEILRDRRGL